MKALLTWHFTLFPQDCVNSMWVCTVSHIHPPEQPPTHSLSCIEKFLDRLRCWAGEGMAASMALEKEETNHCLLPLVRCSGPTSLPPCRHSACSAWHSVRSNGHPQPHTQNALVVKIRAQNGLLGTISVSGLWSQTDMGSSLVSAVWLVVFLFVCFLICKMEMPVVVSSKFVVMYGQRLVLRLPFLRSIGFWNCGPRTRNTTPWELVLEMWMSRFHTDQPDQKLCGWGPAVCIFTSCPRAGSNFENHGFNRVAQRVNAELSVVHKEH